MRLHPAVSSHVHSSPRYPERRVLALAAACTLFGLLGLLALTPSIRVLTHYTPPIVMADRSASPGTALAERVVLVVLRGVSSTDLSAPRDPWRFVQLRRRAGEGAYGIARAVLPSGDAPTWAALISGAPPEISGIVDAQEPGPLAVPTLFDSLAARGQRSAVVASRTAWQSRATLGRPTRLALAPSASRVAEQAVEILRSPTEQLVVILLDPGRVGTLEERRRQLDAQIDSVVGQLDPARDVLIITADHGYRPDGSSGGGEAEVAELPLILWGRGIVSGPIGSAGQQDVAPTIATLLGLPYPAYGGQPLLRVLRLDPAARARELARLLEARTIGRTSATAQQALENAQAALREGRWRDAAESSLTGLAELAPRPQLPWYWASAWLWGGAMPLILLIAARLAGRYRHRLGSVLVLLTGVEGYVLVWSTIFFGLAGRIFSLSAMYGRWSEALMEAGLWSALALATIAVGLGLYRGRAGVWGAATLTGGTSLLIVAFLLVCVSLYLGVAGLPHGRLPNLTGWTVVLLALAQIAGTGLATPLAMLLTALVAEVGKRGR